MADNPTNPNNPAPQLDSSSIKKVQQELSVAQQQMERLLVLQKALQLKLIDEKDAKLFQTFLKQLASTDLSNLKNLSLYVKGGAVKFNELVSFSQQLNKENSVYIKGLIQQNNQLEQMYSNMQTAAKSTNALNTNLNQAGLNIKKVNDNLKQTNSLVDDFVEGYKEGLDNFDETVDLQERILKGFDKLNDAQKKGISLGLEFSDTYTDFSKNLNESLSKTDFRPTVSPIVELDFMGGVADKIMGDIQKVLGSFGNNTFEIDGDVFDASEMQDKIEALEKLYVETVNKSNKIQKSASEGIADYIATKFKITKDIALQLADDMIKDIAAKMQNPNANILSPQRTKEVSDFYNQIKQSNDKALLSMISYTADASSHTSLLGQEFDIVSNKIKQMPKITDKLGLPNRIISETLDTMQRGVRDTVPNFLYNILDLDGAFDKVRTSASQAMAGAAQEALNTGSVMKGVTSAVGGLSSSLLGALGPIGLIAIAVTGLFSLFTQAGASVKQISTDLGVSSGQAYELYQSTLAMTSAVDNMSLKQEDVLDILKKHKEEYGQILDLNNEANQQAVKFSTQLGKQYGVAGGEVYGMTQQLQSLGATQQASEDMAVMTAYASELAGIPFSNITKDLSENSNFVAQAFGGYPQQAVAATVKLRAMGSSLKSMATTMDKMSDASVFLQGMTELNIMTNGAADLSKYYQMMMTARNPNDMAAAEQELNKQIDSMIAAGEDSYWQMKQLEQITGKSSDEIRKGNLLRKQSALIGEDNVKLAGKYLDKMTEADLADAKSIMNANKRFSAAEKFDTVWSSIKDTLMQAVLPLLESMEPILNGILPAVKLIGVVIKGLAAPFSLISDLIKMISGEQTLGDFQSLTNLFGGANDTLGILAKTLMGIVGIFSFLKIGSWLFKGLKSITGMFKNFSGGLKGLKNLFGGKGKFNVTLDALTGNDQCACLKDGLGEMFGQNGWSPDDFGNDGTPGAPGTSTTTRTGPGGTDADGKPKKGSSSSDDGDGDGGNKKNKNRPGRQNKPIRNNRPGKPRIPTPRSGPGGGLSGAIDLGLMLYGGYQVGSAVLEGTGDPESEAAAMSESAAGETDVTAGLEEDIQEETSFQLTERGKQPTSVSTPEIPTPSSTSSSSGFRLSSSPSSIPTPGSNISIPSPNIPTPGSNIPTPPPNVPTPSGPSPSGGNFLSKATSSAGSAGAFLSKAFSNAESQMFKGGEKIGNSLMDVGNKIKGSKTITALNDSKLGQSITQTSDAIKNSKIAQKTVQITDKINDAGSAITSKADDILKNTGQFGATLSKAGKYLGPIGTAVGAGFEYSARKDEGQTETQAITGTAASTVAGLGGAWAGAAIGAGIGSVVPVVGTAIGGLVGGIIGAWGGASAGGAIADKATGVGEQKGEELTEAAANGMAQSMEQQTEAMKKQLAAKAAFPAIYAKMDKIDANIKKIEEDRMKKMIKSAEEQGMKIAGASAEAYKRGMEISTSKSVMKGLDESEINQLKTAGYSDEIIKQLNEGNMSVQDALKAHAKSKGFDLTQDQLSGLSNNFTSNSEKLRISNQMAGMPPTLDIGTDMVKSDGLAMLHKGESVVPADVVSGGYKGKSFEQSLGELGIDMMKSTAFQTYFGGMKVAKAAMQYPTSESEVPLSETVQQTSAPQTQQPIIQTTASNGNQEAVLKQILNAINGLAQRPIAVNFGGTDLKTINSKLKVYNNI